MVSYISEPRPVYLFLEEITVQLFQLFINYHKFYRKQYPLPAVSRLASRGEQWLHVCNTYTDRSQERLEKKSS